DEKAVARAREMFRNPDFKDHLKDLAAKGEPPPAPVGPEEGGTFPVTLRGKRSLHAYAWVEIGRPELHSLHLNNQAEKEPRWQAEWKYVAAAREKGEAVTMSLGTLLYSRKVPDRGRPDPRDREKKYEYFFLTRKPEKGQEITGRDLIAAQAVKGPREIPAIN